MRTLTCLAALLPALAAADTSPLLLAGAQIDATGTTAVQTQPMPKGWFSTRNVLDRTKTSLVTRLAAGATTCSADQGVVATLSSVTAGNFTEVLNPQDRTVRYVWDTVTDLSPFQNRWHHYTGCDGVQVVLGCPEAIPVTFTIEAFAKSGTCQTYVNDLGQTVCAADQAVAMLPAVQEADQVATGCVEEGGDPSCGIGPCESACTQSCDAAFPVGRGADKGNVALLKACKEACPCTCKYERPARCPQPQNCE
ncbi:hypothetical protein [Anaeromyxobacter dehalogenans]|uniref:Uncharacterized protein n=1 Tax=Anaeromyxobacter dehalogenans (strain 2CP-C) TaxID=290397 RepID=Q2INB5_ANADE|nr:hypothetical protein [Anaeromyxobacter dehalogenans]ABC80299.1 hypothetical protein Adeh_0523 [Anaeromyxobacter dehalogenans 2CP-C]